MKFQPMVARISAVVLVAVVALAGCDSEAAKQREADAKRAELKAFFERGDKALAGMRDDIDIATDEIAEIRREDSAALEERHQQFLNELDEINKQ